MVSEKLKVGSDRVFVYRVLEENVQLDMSEVQGDPAVQEPSAFRERLPSRLRLLQGQVPWIFHEKQRSSSRSSRNLEGNLYLNAEGFCTAGSPWTSDMSS